MSSTLTHRYRRRFSSLPSMATAVLLVIGGGIMLGLGPVSAVSAASPALADPLVPLDTATLSSNIRHWTTDYAVMFYAPWCQHCKESFMPLWEDVAMQLKSEDPSGNRKLVVGKFDCEQDISARTFCHEIRLQFYPTFVFFGAGKFHDHDPLSGAVFGPSPTEYESTAMFPPRSMMYHEVMTDWTKTMHFISGSNRVMKRLNIFSGWGGKDEVSSEERLLAEIEELERQNHELAQLISGSGSAAGGASGEETELLPYGNGDVYNELWKVGYDPEFRPIMRCVAELSIQYCDLEGISERDPWCSTVKHCYDTDFDGDECWPSSCLLGEEGCRVTSLCLTTDLIDAYINVLEEEDREVERAAEAGEDEWESWTGQEGSGGPEGEAVAEQSGTAAEQPEVAPGLPPFLGRRPGAGAGGVDRPGDERREAVAS